MDFSKQIKAIRKDFPIKYCKGSRSEFINYDVHMSLRIDFTLNSVDPDEMPPYAVNVAFHLGLHCLHKYPFRVSSIQRVKK